MSNSAASVVTVPNDACVNAEQTALGASGVRKDELEYFREVETTGQELVVTDRGKPVLKIVPYRRDSRAAMLLQQERAGVKIAVDPERLRRALDADTTAPAEPKRG